VPTDPIGGFYYHLGKQQNIPVKSGDLLLINE
jgi:hypothetical protein